jgi:hypothetical protein
MSLVVRTVLESVTKVVDSPGLCLPYFVDRNTCQDFRRQIFKWEKIFYSHSDHEMQEIFVQHFAGREVSCGPENIVTVSACYFIPV